MKKELSLKGMLLGATMLSMAAFPAMAEVTESTPGAVKAVDLLAAWANAGATNGKFSYKDLSGNDAAGTFDVDILPLFTKENIWGDNLAACSSCHSGNTEESLHELDLTSHAGLLKGADALSKPTNATPMLGETIGKTNYDFGHSKMRQRLRDNRMPPNVEFDITEENRDGPCLVDGKPQAGQYGCEVTAVSAMEAWVKAGAKNDDTFKNVISPMFTQDNYWGEGLAACTSCHSGNTEESLHELDLTSHAGLLKGADALSKPTNATPMLGETIGKTDYDFGKSKMRKRLRDNRMPPNVEFDITEENRDGPIVLHGNR